jgi:organic radical activating enzyme
MGGVEGWPTYEQATWLVDQILTHSNHEYRTYNLLGGEPTLWKHFGELCGYIKEHDQNSVIQVLTNGSRTLRWWEKFATVMDKVVISHHSHTATPEHTVSVIERCQPYNSVSVQLLMDYHNFDNCLEHFYYILDRSPGISITVKKAETELGSGQWQPYTVKQLAALDQAHQESKINNKKDSKIERLPQYKKKFDRVLYGSDGEQEWVTSNKDLILSKSNFFKGWKCNIGIDMLSVKSNGDLKPSSACFKDELLGNYRKGTEIKWPTSAYVCDYVACFCGADIEVEKHDKK